MEERYLKLRDGKQLFYRVWEVESPVAALHINHGMAEHSLRYSGFAAYMNQQGYTVYAQDHRGHGNTVDEDLYGYFADENGWRTICDDSFELDQLIAKEHPDIPHLIFGHSMGSFLTRTNIALHSEAYTAAVICGTGGPQGIVGRIGRRIALSHAKRKGSKTADPVLDKLAFGSYNKNFKGEGQFAWLSSDKKEVEAYEKDPFCGFICSAMFYADLIEGSFTANDKKLASNIRKDLPILLISGAMDPVGGNGKGVRKSYEMYKNAGIKDVRLILIDKGRHEILNDVMRNEVMDDVASFYKEILNGKH